MVSSNTNRYGSQEVWGLGPADEDDETYPRGRHYRGPYGVPQGPRPYQRGEGAPPSRPGTGGRVAATQRHYHYPYYGFGYTGYGQFGGGYGAEKGRILYETSGPYAGIGPRGYQKSDEHIRDEVNEALTVDSWLDPTDIEVRVVNGEVTLEGAVATMDQRRRAAEDAWHVPGVLGVRNHLRVGSMARPGGPA